MNIVNCYVCPMKGYGNNPNLYMTLSHDYQITKEAIYTNTEACYWYQDAESGVTDFLFHTPLDQCQLISPGHWRSPKSEGFGGRVFTLKMANGIIDLVGPWSGGCYCANQYLPEPAIEVAFRVPKYGFTAIAGYMTWQKVREYLPKGWEIIDSREYGKHWPELIYNGQRKKDWSKELMDQLDVEYQKHTPKYNEPKLWS